MEQFFEHSDLGLGALTFQKGPGTIHCWTGRIADTEILFSIILNTSELRSANLDFIRSVLQNWREYLSKAEHEIQAQIGKSPEKFGLQRAPFPETEIPAEQPQFLFYDETEWGLHFEICTLPVGEPFGLMVEFSGDTPTDVYGLSEAEEIEVTREIDPAQAICSACYSKEDKWERGSWDDLRKRKNADEIQMFTIAKKVDEAFQVPENEAYVCREKLEIIQAEALEREMEAFHRRRILCMVEIFSKIDCGILPISALPQNSSERFRSICGHRFHGNPYPVSGWIWGQNFSTFGAEKMSWIGAILNILRLQQVISSRFLQ